MNIPSWKKYELKYPDKIKAKHRSYYLKNKKRILAYLKSWKKKNLDRVREHNRAWYLKKRDGINSIKRKPKSSNKKLCDCGKTAFMWKNSGWVCKDCHAIEMRSL